MKPVTRRFENEQGEDKTITTGFIERPYWFLLCQTDGEPIEFLEFPLKGFADGSLGSIIALFFEPYLDDPKTSGLPSDEMFPESKMLNFSSRDICARRRRYGPGSA